MKQLFYTLIVIILCVTTSYAQEYRELLYLKNGSIVKGVIIEQVLNQSFKIETSDGSIFVYKWEDVEKIGKEKVVQESKSKTKNRGLVKYQSELQIAFGVGIGEIKIDRVYAQTIQGVRIGDYFSIGLGLGVTIIPTYVTNSTLEMYVPIFANTKGYLPISEKLKAFLSLDIGGTVGVGEKMKDFRGLMLSPSLGMSISNTVNVGLGYEIQRLSSKYTSAYLNMNAVVIKLGCMF